MPTISDFIPRAPTREDAQNITDLIIAFDLATIGQPNFELASLLRDWSEPGFDLAKDAVVVTTHEGKIIGYESILEVDDKGRIQIDGYVHPDHTAMGIGTSLLRWAEARGRERMIELPVDRPACLQTFLYGAGAPAAHALFQAEGYFIVRHFWRMEIDLTEPPPVPKWPDGITVRTFVLSQDEYATWQAFNDIFKDDWQTSETSFDAWVAAKITNEAFDTSLWFLAMDGDQIAAMSRGMIRLDNGWIRTFGVCSAWRRQGLAIALLNHTFGEFYRRGKFNIGLGVDSENPTGATRVYERAGMHVAQVLDTYEKPLSPGKSPNRS